MPSLILQLACRHLLPIFILISLFFFLRGHDHPGGGFIGGLLAAEGFILLVIGGGVDRAAGRLPVEPGTLLAAGLLVSLGSGLPALWQGRPFLTGQWIDIPLPFLGQSVAVGTPILFDAGVYLLVAGIVLMMVFAVARE